MEGTRAGPRRQVRFIPSQRRARLPHRARFHCWHVSSPPLRWHCHGAPWRRCHRLIEMSNGQVGAVRGVQTPCWWNTEEATEGERPQKANTTTAATLPEDAADEFGFGRWEEGYAHLPNSTSSPKKKQKIKMKKPKQKIEIKLGLPQGGTLHFFNMFKFLFAVFFHVMCCKCFSISVFFLHFVGRDGHMRFS